MSLENTNKPVVIKVDKLKDPDSAANSPGVEFSTQHDTPSVDIVRSR